MDPGRFRTSTRPPLARPCDEWSLPGRQIRPSGVHAVRVASVVNINEVLDSHVSLEVDCVGRLYLNAYVPKLQVAGQVVTFLSGHLGFPVPSPSLMEKIGNRFRREVKAFAARRHIPVLVLKKPDRTRWDDRKLDHVRPYLDAAELCQPSQLRSVLNLAPAGSSSKVSGRCAVRWMRTASSAKAVVTPPYHRFRRDSVMNPATG